MITHLPAFFVTYVCYIDKFWHLMWIWEDSYEFSRKDIISYKLDPVCTLSANRNNLGLNKDLSSGMGYQISVSTIVNTTFSFLF